MDFSDVATSRRSVHQYADEDLDRETVAEIVEAAISAPSSYNLQPWEFLVLDADEDRERLKEAAYGQEHVTDAPVAVVVLGNLDPAAHADRVVDDWLDKGYLPNEKAAAGVHEQVDAMADWPETERRVWTTRSTALVAQQLMLAAWDRDVATCPMGGFDADGVVDEFSVPDGYEPVMLLTMGHPAEDAADLANERKWRRPVDEVVHFDEFEPVTDETSDTPEPAPAPTDD